VSSPLPVPVSLLFFFPAMWRNLDPTLFFRKTQTLVCASPQPHSFPFFFQTDTRTISFLPWRFFFSRYMAPFSTALSFKFLDRYTLPFIVEIQGFPLVFSFLFPKQSFAPMINISSLFVTSLLLLVYSM